MTKLLEDLMEIVGTSGNESKVRSFIMKEIKKHVKDIKVDKFGNLVAHKKGKGLKVMLVAHMDEVGLMVRSISENGDLHCSEIGGVEAISLIGQRVDIKTKKGSITGVITLPEISDSIEVEDVPGIEDLIVDTGLNKKELKNLGVTIGSFMNLKQETEILGNKDIILGKALDDRSGCYVLIELAKRLKKADTDIYFVFTVQEEVGLYGSKTSLHGIDPDWAVVVDVTASDDANEDMQEITKTVGNGPCITIKDADMISNVCISDWLKQIAKKKKIPVQLEVSDIGTTDALSISIAKGGIPTSVIGPAVRNLHTTASVASLKDIENIVKLLEELLKKHPKKCMV